MTAEELEVPEVMGDFFNARAAGYDDHQREYAFSPGTSFVEFYEALASPIPETGEPLQILDLGCGTGLELDALFERAPNILVTGIDLSAGLLELLREKHSARMSQITLVLGSYLTTPLGTRAYDYAIAAMANHHLLHNAKRALYKRIHAALKPGGKFVEGESVTRPDLEDQFIAEYHEQTAMVPPADEGYYHVDVPLSLKTQKDLLLEAGFTDFEVLWREDWPHGWNKAVYVVTA
jgi:tRNA (cmo5U34)-methyltransferase